MVIFVWCFVRLSESSRMRTALARPASGIGSIRAKKSSYDEVAITAAPILLRRVRGVPTPSFCALMFL